MRVPTAANSGQVGLPNWRHKRRHNLEASFRDYKHRFGKCEKALKRYTASETPKGCAVGKTHLCTTKLSPQARRNLPARSARRKWPKKFGSFLPFSSSINNQMFIVNHNIRHSKPTEDCQRLAVRSKGFGFETFESKFHSKL